MQLVRRELVDGRVMREVNHLKLVVAEPAALRLARQRHWYPPVSIVGDRNTGCSGKARQDHHSTVAATNRSFARPVQVRIRDDAGVFSPCFEGLSQYQASAPWRNLPTQ